MHDAERNIRYCLVNEHLALYTGPHPTPWSC